MGQPERQQEPEVPILIDKATTQAKPPEGRSKKRSKAQGK